MQTTSFYVFTIKPKYQYSALVKMAYAAVLFRRAKGCRFVKVMGSGGGTGGFGLSPNFKVYAAIMVWDHVENLKAFEANNRLFSRYCKMSEHVEKRYGVAYQVHGKWSGVQPFEVRKDLVVEDGQILVLTRARIKWRMVKKFWDFVPKTTEALQHVNGRLFSIGVGEFPLLLQATLSVWESQEHMRAYAYKNPLHLEAIQKTKELNWYSEELFARFHLIEL